MSKDSDRVWLLRESFVGFEAHLAMTRQQVRDARAAGDLSRAIDLATRLRLELDEALKDLTTTEPTTAEET